MIRTFLFQLLLVGLVVILGIYTVFAFQNQGAGLFPVFLENIFGLKWNGQFNLDFSCYLLVSGVWIAWRNNFSMSGLAIALVASVVGFMAFAPYLIYLIYKEKGNFEGVLLQTKGTK